MVINFEIRPGRPQNGLLLEILSKSALALAQEGLQTAPRLSVLFGTIVFLFGPNQKEEQVRSYVYTLRLIPF